MNTQILNKKIELIQWLITLDDSEIIDKIIEIRKEKSADWWENLQNAEKESINKGVSDAESNNLKLHSDVRKLYEKWL